MIHQVFDPMFAVSMYELYNTDTEQVEAIQSMTMADAEERNRSLRRLGEPQRWVRQSPEDAE